MPWAGTDVAVETADVALMADDLSKLTWLVTHSQRTLIRDSSEHSLRARDQGGVRSPGLLRASLAPGRDCCRHALLVLFSALRLLGGPAEVGASTRLTGEVSSETT